MKQITDVNELHEILLDIAKEFHGICTENGIPYYMLGGTMLGAIRHKGFIPWDDDMDFGVRREHFNRLKDVLRAKLDPRYKVLTFPDSDAMYYDFIKIVDTRTMLKELYKEHVTENGINIDIFPLDHATSKKGNSKKIEHVLRLHSYRHLSIKPRPMVKKIIALAVKTVFFWWKKDTVIRYIDKHLIEKSGDYIANVYGAWGAKETVPKEVMGKPVLYAFENTEFYGVAMPDAYLKSLYGDYMQLPPAEKRHLHLVGAYWK